MTTYELDNLPDHSEYRLDPLPEEVLPKVHEVLKQVMDEKLAVVTEVRMGRLFERKGYLSVDAVGEPRNTSYGLNEDDVLITLSVRVPLYHLSSTTQSVVAEIDHEVKELNDEAKRREIQSEIDAAEAHEKMARDRAQALRNQLKDL